MIAQLKRMYEQFGFLTRSIIQYDKDSPAPSSYARNFGSISMAFQRIFSNVLDKTRSDLQDKLSTEVAPCQPYEDFIVVDQRLTVLIQPSVPIPHGYGRYWVFKPDQRPNVDITLGVPLSQGDDYHILGYFPFPRLMLDGSEIRLTLGSEGLISMYGHTGLELLKEILQCESPKQTLTE